MKILGTGSALPAREVTNEQLAAVVDTSDEWIATRTGIHSRRIAEENDTAFTMARDAAKMALDRAKIAGADIKYLICATVTNESIVPSLSCLLQRDLQLPERILAFDVNAACTGYIYALALAQSLLREGQYALTVASERLTRVTDFTDRATCVLFGDGAGAAVAGFSEDPFRFIPGARGDAGALHIGAAQAMQNPFNAKCETAEPPRIRMDGQAIFKFAVDAIVRAVRDVLAQEGLVPEDVRHFVCHQANRRILESAAKRLGVPLERFFINIETRGNTSAASVAIALDELNGGGNLKRGDRVVLAGFGGGLTYGAIYLEW